MKYSNTMKTVAVALMIFFGLQSFSSSDVKMKVEQAVTDLTSAMISADEAKLNALTHDMLSYGHSGGKVESKGEFISNIVSGKSDFVSIDLSDQTVEVSGNIAIVRHILSATTNDSGKPGTVKLKILLVWKKSAKHWQLIARQAVKTT